MEERLQKVLARAGVASRRAAEKLIADGRVSVNGEVVRELGTKVDPAVDEVRVDTVALPRDAVSGERRNTYLLLHKPKGVLCTVRDDHGRATVLDLVPPFPGKRLFPVGRLDEESDGLVLLTDDGELTQRLTHPSFGVPKTYDVRVKGRLTPDAARTFEAGVWLSEGRTGRSRVQIRHAGPKVSHVLVTLTEGKNREIRRAFAKLEFPVLSLRRTQIGPIVSRGLKPGQFRPLDAAEVHALRAATEQRGEGRMRPLRRRAKTPHGRGGKPDPAKAPRVKRPSKGGAPGRGRKAPPSPARGKGGAAPGGRRAPPRGGRSGGRAGGGGGGARGGRR